MKKLFLVYCHPCKDSFTHMVKEEFIKGLKKSHYEYELSDLYEMNFNAEISEEEYLREAYYEDRKQLADDVLEEQRKVQEADGIVFIYPVFWTEAPAKLVGWFDRVWTCGFAYGKNPNMKTLDKALFIAIAGKTAETLMEVGEEQAMKTVMLGDRIRNRTKSKEMIILDETTHWNEEVRKKNIEKHGKTAFELGVNFWS